MLFMLIKHLYMQMNSDIKVDQQCAKDYNIIRMQCNRVTWKFSCFVG